jgi:hypothetical protein
MDERQGIEIDFCPQCRGVWLDRGELDKIIERAASLSAFDSYRDDDDDFDDDDRHRNRDQPRPDRAWGDRNDDEYRRRKRKSFLSELFDFG